MIGTLILKLQCLEAIGEIYKKLFEGSEYDSNFYYFDPLSVTDGEKRGSFYRFTVEITATTGDDANLFKVDVSPE